MLNFINQCHLTSLPLEPNEDVIILPVEYSYISEVNSLCYGSNTDCRVSWLPLFGKYNNQTSISITPNSENVCNTFRTNINKSLHCSKSVRDNSKKRMFNFDSFFIFNKESGSNDVLTGSEFVDNCDLSLLAEDESRLLNIESIDNNNDLINKLLTGSVIEDNGSRLFRLNCIIIKKSAIDSLINSLYTDKYNNSFNSILDIICKPLNKEKYDFPSVSGIEKALGFFNISSGLSYRLHLLINTIIESEIHEPMKDKNLINLAEHCALWSIIDDVYRHTTRSYYPTAERKSNLKILHTLNKIINKKIKTY